MKKNGWMKKVVVIVHTGRLSLPLENKTLVDVDEQNVGDKETEKEKEGGSRGGTERWEVARSFFGFPHNLNINGSNATEGLGRQRGMRDWARLAYEF